MIPKVETEIGTFQQSITQPCFDFEKNMTLYGYFHENVTDPKLSSISVLLSKTAREISSYFLEGRRVEILAKARSLVLGDYHNTMLGTGDAQEDDPATAGKNNICSCSHL
jgi:hypothetical protein